MESRVAAGSRTKMEDVDINSEPKATQVESAESDQSQPDTGAQAGGTLASTPVKEKRWEAAACTTNAPLPTQPARLSNSPGSQASVAHPPSFSESEDDASSRTAVALAAVAAAATANNSSPSAAAQTARAVAQTIERSNIQSPTAQTHSIPPEPKVVQNVKVPLVKAHLLSLALEATNSEERRGQNNFHFLEHLARGHNDAFLQHLLLFVYYRPSEDESTDDTKQSGKEGDEESTPPEDDPDRVLARKAAEDLFEMFAKLEAAYNSLLDMLPKTGKTSGKGVAQSEGRDLQVSPSNSNKDGSGNLAELPERGEFSERDDDAMIVPDLLPPLTSANGDATIEFFRACQGQSPSTEAASEAATEATEASSKSGSNSFSGSSSENTNTSSVDVGKDKKGLGKATSLFVNSPFGKSAKSASNVVNTGGSVLSTMISTVRKNTSVSAGVIGTKGFGVFRKNVKVQNNTSDSRAGRDLQKLSELLPGEYAVQIEREMLGLTVENVLERTVVRTLVPNGPAKKAGVKVGSLIVKVGTVETKNLTHFETIDELRQSQRPLQLVLRLVSDEALRSAREEMGRLIRGSGFGVIKNREPPPSSQVGNSESSSLENAPQSPRHLLNSDPRIDAFSTFIRRRFDSVVDTRNRKEETLGRACERLVWILSAFVYGMEREAFNLGFTTHDGMQEAELDSSPTKSSNYSLYDNNAKDFADAAKSVAKTLHDFLRKNLDPVTGQGDHIGTASSPGFPGPAGTRRGRKPPMMPPPPPPSGGPRRKQPSVSGMKLQSDILHEKPLLQIGDVLHRTRSFLADPTSPPAALLRGEVIAFLCDVLDIDTEMELSEEEAASQTAGGGKSGPIADIGSAGSLLKLIVLNCSIMRSPGCESVLYGDADSELENEIKRRFGSRAKVDAGLHAGNRFLSVVHRLAASRSTSARITACSLGPVLWGHLDFPHQLQLRGVITRALHDAEVIVRKSTATVLHEIAELVFDPRAVPWLVLMCERAMTDPEPQLRSAAMTLTWHLAEHLPNAFLGDASQGSRFLRRLPNRSDPVFADVYLLQCKLLPVATRLAEDRSPPVRLAVAAQCDRLCHALGDHWSSVIIDVLLALLSDADDRVRSEAVLCVPRLSEIVLLSSSPGAAPISDVSVLDSLLPAALLLQKDASASVRISLATSAGELLTLLVGLQSIEEVSPSGTSEGEGFDCSRKLKKHVDDLLIPIVQKLLHDTDPEVTSSALRAVTNASRGTVREIRPRQQSMASEDDNASLSSNMSMSSRSEKKEPVFLPVLSEQQVLRLLPTLAELANSKQWRVRQSAVEIVPALLGCTENLRTRAEISLLCIKLMDDMADAVRRTAAECLCLGGSSLGSHGESVGAEWISSIVIPHVRKCALHSNSKQRLLSLKMVESVLLNGSCPSKWSSQANTERLTDSPKRELAVIALSLSNDKVPNVRLNVGRVLESVINIFEEEDLSFIKEVLLQQLVSEQEREGGGDRDVVFFANRCLRKINVLLDGDLPSQEELVIL